MSTNGSTKGVAIEVPRALFAPGTIHITCGVKALLESQKLGTREVCTFIGRHLSGDWGDLCPFDKRQNEDALHNGARIFSAYRSAVGDKFYVITEAKGDNGHRENTTVLLSDEY